jgi:hypothetical protein
MVEPLEIDQLRVWQSAQLLLQPRGRGGRLDDPPELLRVHGRNLSAAAAADRADDVVAEVLDDE